MSAPPSARRAARAAALAGAAALACALAGCGPHLSADDPAAPVGPAGGPWWLGDWVVDTGALDESESFRALEPDARRVARDLLAGARWRLAFDSRLAHLPDGRLVPFRVENTSEDAIVVVLSSGEQLALQRRPGGLRLASHDLPLRRAD